MDFESIRPYLTAEPLFEMGELYVTPTAYEDLKKAGQYPMPLVARHCTGDFGELKDEERSEMLRRIRDGGEVSSCYRLADGVKIWISTYGDRKRTELHRRHKDEERVLRQIE